jgi:colicin import membrane protein
MAHRESAGLRPWLGSAALHIVLLALIVMFAMRWRSEPPMPQLAIEGEVVRYQDLPSSVKAGKPIREPVPQPTPPMPAPAPPVETPTDTQREAEQRAREADAATAREHEARLAAEREALERERAEEKAREAAAATEAQRREETAAAEKRKAEAEDMRKADALKAQQAREAQEREKADREAKARAEAQAKAKAAHEAALQRELASEEEGEAVQRSGVVDEYRTLLVQTIERNWIRPPSAKPGLECTLDVTQAAGGSVVNVTIGACNGDQAVRESVANAVYRSSPLPAPRDPRAFQRRLVIVFKPTE